MDASIYYVLIIYFINYQILKIFYVYKLKISNIILNPFYNEKDFYLIEKIRIHTKNKTFDLIITDTNINNEKFFSQILFKFFKPNLSIIDKNTWDNFNDLEKEMFLISEMKYRKINFLIEYIIYLLEAYKLFNLLIVYPLLRFKRLKIDNNLYEIYGKDYLQLLCKLSYENNIKSILYRLVNNFAFIFFIQFLFYDYFNTMRIYNLIKKNIQVKFCKKMIYILK